MLQNISQIITFRKSSLRIIALFCLSAVVTFFSGCANVGPPPGGPVDKKGPEILSCQPLDGSIFVPRDAVIEFKVDEWINGDSFKNAFFISPEPAEEAIFKIGLYKLKVIYKNGFDENTTYVVTIGTDFNDHNRNPLEESYTIAFSTGSKLDFGMVKGTIVGGVGTGYIAALYQLEYLNSYSDSSEIELGEDDDEEEIREIRRIIGPYYKKGKYLTQSGKDNSFSLPYIPPGDYRLIVFSDKDKDRVYDPGTEELGLAWTDVSINNDTSRVIVVLPITRMPEPPFIQNVEAKNHTQLNVLIDRPLEFLPILSDFSIVDTTTGEGLKLENLYRHPIDSSVIIVNTGLQDSSVYSLKVSGGKDNWGESMSDSIIFNGNAGADTLAPVIVEASVKADSSGGVLSFLLSENVDASELAAGLSLKDSSTLSESIEVKRIDNWTYEIASKRFIINDTIYFNQRFLKDNSGNTGLDSTILLPVQPYEDIAPQNDFGTLSGTLYFNDKIPDRSKGKFKIYAVSTDNKLYGRFLDTAGFFKLDSLPAGHYTLEAYLDADNNGRYNYGLLYPFIPPERYTVAKNDTFRVRSGWETDGAVIDFK